MEREGQSANHNGSQVQTFNGTSGVGHHLAALASEAVLPTIRQYSVLGMNKCNVVTCNTMLNANDSCTPVPQHSNAH
jgi:hypothetical protein